MTATKLKRPVRETVSFSMHPRVFAALGADLVTSDTVALIELIKNSYDAMATNVWLRFEFNERYGDHIEIVDDGDGMTDTIIRQAWCVVATPFRKENPVSSSGKRSRRSSGAKGLGRLSAARLGSKLEITTQARNSDCFRLSVDWDEIAAAHDVRKCGVTLEQLDDSPFHSHGTIIRISDLSSEWTEDEFDELEENLSRLLSPFTRIEDFKIFLQRPDSEDGEAVQIMFPDFLNSPVYQIKGTVDDQGTIKAQYKYAPVKGEGARTKALKLIWDQIYSELTRKEQRIMDPGGPECGAFQFEIRAWDTTGEGLSILAEHLELDKNIIKKDISAFRGISLYRDGVLVLPKSDNSRDWLGIDLRRVSRVGSRLSTTQIVGYAAISQDENPDITDTSDRERLASNTSTREFQMLIIRVLRLMEAERDFDRDKSPNFKPVKDLFAAISASEAIETVKVLVNEGAEAVAVVPVIEELGRSLVAARREIENRFYYYSRMAAVGTISSMLVHEIRNRTTAIGACLKLVDESFDIEEDKRLERAYELATNSVTRLERLSDTFAPLASRGYKRGRRSSIVEERIRLCVELAENEIRKLGVTVRIPSSTTHVQINPSELDTVFINLISNTLFWIKQTPKEDRLLEFTVRHDEKHDRIVVFAHDSGTGVDEEDAERIFLPGVTKRGDEGIGMGLTVAAELISDHGGRMYCKYPPRHGGASFGFDLPAKR